MIITYRTAPAIKTAILMSFGSISAIFMSQDKHCGQVVMPTKELEQEADELLNTIARLLMEK